MTDADVFTWTADWARARGVRTWTAESVDSTNSFAKSDETHAPSPPSIGKVSEPTLYLARTQTAGRGRGPKTWESPASGALLSSWSYRLASPAQPLLSPLVGLAVHDALRRSFGGLDLGLKAPNDVYSGERKIAGILIESVLTGSDVKLVVGLGLNVTAKPPTVPTSGAIGDTIHVTREAWLAFLDALRTELTRALTAGQDTALRADVRDRLREALNTFALLDEPVLAVDEHGQIETARGLKHWHRL